MGRVGGWVVVVMRLTPAVVAGLTLPGAVQAHQSTIHNGNSGTDVGPTVSVGNNNSNYYNNYVPVIAASPLDFSTGYGAAAAAWRHEQNKQATAAQQTAEKNSASLVTIAAAAAAKSHGPKSDKTAAELVGELKQIEKLTYQLLQAESRN